MRIKPEYSLCDIDGEYVVVDERAKSAQHDRVVVLNRREASLWCSVVGRSFSRDSVCDLMDDFTEGEATATLRSECAAFIKKLIKLGVVGDD